MKWTYLVEITEVVEDEESSLPFAINLFRRTESATGRFFVVLFLGWLMIPEAIVLAALYVVGFLILLALCCVPILNICIFKDCMEEGETIGCVVAVIGFLADIAAIIWLIVRSVG